MLMLRHLIAIAVLPFTATVLVPWWIQRRYQVPWTAGATPVHVATQLLGVASLGIGLVLFGWSLRNFAKKGGGTLAPWDPPPRLVVEGPYRHVRNPMISGVLFIVFGEALALASWPHARWALFFLVLNLVYIPALEEPLLERRFGNAYREYKRHVPRFVPRARAWTPTG